MLIAEDGSRLLPIEGLDVSRVVIDQAITLHLGEGDQDIVRIEGTFTLRVAGQSRSLTPARPAELGPALALFGQSVVAASISAAGRLTLEFADRQLLTVDPDPQYEAWQVQGPRGFLVVCAPGGKIVVWG